MNITELKRIIRRMIIEISNERDVLAEPDLNDDSSDKDEASVAGAVAGVTTPLGTDASGGRRKKKKNKK